jgi:hypothetical protein
MTGPPSGDRDDTVRRVRVRWARGQEASITTPRRRPTFALVALALAACGDEPAPPTPAPRPAAAAVPEAARVAPETHDVRRLLETCKRECVEAFRMQDPDERAVLDRLQTIDASPTAGEEEWARLSETVARIRTRNERLRTDPRFRDAERKANWVRENPVFKDTGLTRVFADPYVIFQEVKRQDVRDTKQELDVRTGASVEIPVDGTENPSKVRQNQLWAARAESLARRGAALFNETHRRFRELFADPMKLPTLAEKGRMLTALVMWDRASFDALLREAGQPVSPGTRGFYSPARQKVFTYLGAEALMHLDEIPCADGFVQKTSDQAMLHSAACQLLHEYSAIARGRPLLDSEVEFEAAGPSWLYVGLAEFLSAVEVEAHTADDLVGTKWRHERVLLDRLDDAQRSREEAEKWTLAEVMKRSEPAESRLVVAPSADGPPMSSLYCARAWAFVHFLWNYDAGKYRAKFVSFVGESFLRPTTSEQFAKSMGRPDAANWGLVEREFDWYWEQLLDRRIGKDKTTGQWATPSTDAPAGRVEDDEAFCAAWKEKRAGK